MSHSRGQGTLGFDAAGEPRQFLGERADPARISYSHGGRVRRFHIYGKHRHFSVAPDAGPRTSLWPALLGALCGTVLELGPGAGRNRRYFSPDVRWLLAEPDNAARNRTRVEELELPDASVDAVVCSFVLCSVTDLPATLAGVRRVLRPGGRFVFAEHVAAPAGTWVRRGQNLLAVLPTRCRPNQETATAVMRSGFTIVDLHRFTLPGPCGVGIPHLAGAAELNTEGHHA